MAKRQNSISNCEYNALKEEMIRDRLVVGIQDTSLSQQLQLDADLTLDKAKTKVRQREAVAEQQKVLKGHSTLEEVHTGKRTQFPRKSTGRKGSGSGSTSSARKKCTRCGKESHPRPAKEAECHKCGHYSSCCFSKKVAEVTTENVLSSAFLDTVDVEQSNTWIATVSLNNRATNFKLDTGYIERDIPNDRTTTTTLPSNQDTVWSFSSNLKH